MKKYTPSTLDLILIIGIIMLGYFIVQPIFTTTLTFNTEDRTMVYQLPPDPDSLYKLKLEDSLPYRAIKQQIDSIDFQSFIARKQQRSTTTFYGGVVGLKETLECDTCDSKNFRQPTINESIMTKKYYLVLSDYTLLPNTYLPHLQPVYFKNKGTLYKKAVVLDSISKIDSTHYFRWQKEVVNYGIDLSEPDEKRKNFAEISIPISHDGYVFHKLLTFLVSIIVILLMFACVIGSSISFIFSLYRGEAFTEKNYLRLLYIGYPLLIIPFSTFLVKYIYHLAYKKYIPADAQFHFQWNSNIAFIIIGIIALLLAKAIKKGITIQEDQDLTI